MERQWPPADDSEFLHIPERLRRAHDHSSAHRDEVLSSAQCGCLHCLATFPPSDIVEWIDDDEAGIGQTATCPKCGIDSVLGDKAGFPVTRDFMEKMQHHWFEP